jgi:unsaturated rhamnogalacturonyl hydrolase
MAKCLATAPYANDEVTKQLLIYYKHLNDPATGLLWHAYDESGAQAWANPTTHTSAYHWCRAIGWFGMTLIQILDILPKNHPQRNELIKIVQQLAQAYEKYQDPKTGLWYQIVDKPEVARELAGNIEFKHVQLHDLDGSEARLFAETLPGCGPERLSGVMTKLSKDADGMTNLIRYL